MIKDEAEVHDLIFPKERRRRGISKGVYLVPSLLTLGALFSGFFAILFTLNSVISDQHEFRTAVLAIIFAGFIDNLDGRMARLMRAESEFGSHLDSIADVVSFGVAPAVLVYCMALSPLGRLGWFAAFMLLACAAIRLARFNVLARVVTSKKYFKGMSSPIAAAGLALISLIADEQMDPVPYRWTMFTVSIGIAILMVSNVRFRSFKDLDIRKHPVQMFLVSALILALVITLGEYALFGFFIFYLVFGLCEELILFRRRRRSDPKASFLPFGEK